MDDLHKLDELLSQALSFLAQQWFDEDTGIVVCCLNDGDKSVFATSVKKNENWLHAERNAYQQFCSQFGAPTQDAIFIVSLSPCVKDLAYRAEPCCAEFLQSLGITRTHFGVLDTFHTSSLEDYQPFGISATLTQQPHLAEMCQRLKSIFPLIYSNGARRDLLEVKRELGAAFFPKGDLS